MATPSLEEKESSSPEPDLKPIVGANLRRIRVRRGLSLERLAQASGVSRAMLSQIELGHSTPTITVLWKVARSLQIPFSAFLTDPSPPCATLLRREDATHFPSSSGALRSRPLFPPFASRQSEFYELTLPASKREELHPLPPGTTENLVVNQGVIQVHLEGVSHRLEAGDALYFQADVPHAYENLLPTAALLYLVLHSPSLRST